MAKELGENVSQVVHFCVFVFEARGQTPDAILILIKAHLDLDGYTSFLSVTGSIKQLELLTHYFAGLNMNSSYLRLRLAPLGLLVRTWVELCHSAHVRWICSPAFTVLQTTMEALRTKKPFGLGSLCSLGASSCSREAVYCGSLGLLSAWASGPRSGGAPRLR